MFIRHRSLQYIRSVLNDIQEIHLLSPTLFAAPTIPWHGQKSSQIWIGMVRLQYFSYYSSISDVRTSADVWSLPQDLDLQLTIYWKETHAFSAAYGLSERTSDEALQSANRNLHFLGFWWCIDRIQFADCELHSLMFRVILSFAKYFSCSGTSSEGISHVTAHFIPKSKALKIFRSNVV
jgi:hypothetical protein